MDEERSAGGMVADEFGAELGDAALARDPTAVGGNNEAGPRAYGGLRAPASDAPATSAGPATAGGGPDTALIPVGPGARGVTADTIRVGAVSFDLDQTEAGYRAVGGASPGYSEGGTTTGAMGDAVTAYINERDGVAGRKLEMVWHHANIAELWTPEGRRREAQRACATWTEDNNVFAMVGVGLLSEIFFDCARRNNVVMMPHTTGLGVDEQFLSELHPLWYSTNRMIAERRDRNLVENLVRRGVLTPDAKVGIMIQDWGPVKRGVPNAMEPALAAHGIEVAARAVYPDTIQSPWDTYVLQFRSAGVTHVLASQNSPACCTFLLMMRSAENQGWRPTWGLGSDNYPDERAPREQLANTFVMSWVPGDVGEIPETETRIRCEEAAQEPVRDPNAGNAGHWVLACEDLFFFQAALNRAPEVSAAAMPAAMEALGDSYQSMVTIGGQTRFAANRPDGAAVQRDVVYDSRCADDATRCWRYSGNPRPMP